MKKMVLAVLLSSSVAFAGGYTKQDRLDDMHKMADAMGTIQTGFFFNNYETVAMGVEKLSDAARRIKPPLEEVEEKNPMARYMNEKVKMTGKIVKKIDQKSLTILQRYKKGDSTQAVQAYSKILDQCIKCHSEMRMW